MPPTFSLLHPTARVPDGWLDAYQSWADTCARPDSCEYILAVDADVAQRQEIVEALILEGLPISARLVWNHGRKCTVDAWNAAARASSGKVLICVADDCFMQTPSWDQILLARIGDLDRECVPWIIEQRFPHIMTHPILTRAYYERPGRGGHPNGELLYAGYVSVGSDDDFTLVAQRDGVALPLPEIKWEHRHPYLNEGPDSDDVYRWSNRPEAVRVRNEVLERRIRENFKS